MEELINSITGQITTVFEAKYQGFIELAPFIIGALGIFVLGLLLAELAARLILRMSEKLRLEIMSEKTGLKHFLERTGVKQSPSRVIAKTLKAYLIFVFFIEATKVAQLTEVAEFLATVRGYIPDLIIALFIMLVGIRIGNTIAVVVETSLSITRSNTARALGIAAKSTVIAFAILASLSQLQIAEILIHILFIGFVSMLALAGGLAFGLGGKDVVKELLVAIKNMELIDMVEAKYDKKEEKEKK
ncbi:hypothetical protein JXD20_02165 [Candidatus Peregrinibacteria bacterium]|nr:hypothetical protein [Candidatus Peregrinibacteria bacterium]